MGTLLEGNAPGMAEKCPLKTNQILLDLRKKEQMKKSSLKKQKSGKNMRKAGQFQHWNNALTTVTLNHLYVNHSAS